MHGETVVDPWHYLRDREHPETIPYLEAENRYAEAVTAAAKPLEDALYEEMVGRLQQTDTSAAWPRGGYEYYSRTEQGRQYRILCRRALGGTETEEILLDCNALAEGHSYFSLAFDQVSPDGKTLAWAVNTDGSEVYTLRFKDLTTGTLLPDAVPGVYYSAAWGDNGTFFYTVLNEAKRPWQVWRHVPGSGAPDALIFEEADGRFNVSIDRARTGRYLFLSCVSDTTTEVRYLETSNLDGAFQLLRERRQDVEYFVEHQADWFYIRTNEDGRNFRLLRLSCEDPAPAGWTEVIPHREEVTLEQVDGFENHLVVTERANGLKRLRIFDSRTGDEHFVSFDEPVYTLLTERNEEYSTTKFRFAYSSLIAPRAVYAYDMDTRERELKKQVEVLGGYDPANYVSERVFATAPDGVQVPISLVWRKGLERDGGNPLYLYGYGSYGIVTEPAFVPERVSLLDRGFVFAIAHIRGSGDLGRRWYEDGKLLKKRNSFDDFIACAEHLIALGYTSPNRLAVSGRSAGGLLMGAITNMRPELFQVVATHVPFVDVVNTMLDPTLPLTVIEYEEWGNPEERGFYDYMRSYAPYENVEAKAYPNIVVTAGLNDPRVPYWEPAKWVAKLRSLHTGDNVIVLKTNMGAGHGGPSGRYEKLRETAWEYAFVISRCA